MAHTRNPKETTLAKKLFDKITSSEVTRPLAVASALFGTVGLVNTEKASAHNEPPQDSSTIEVAHQDEFLPNSGSTVYREATENEQPPADAGPENPGREDGEPVDPEDLFRFFGVRNEGEGNQEVAEVSDPEGGADLGGRVSLVEDAPFFNLESGIYRIPTTRVVEVEVLIPNNGVRIRPDASTDNTPIRTTTNGERLVILGQEEVQGLVWYQVDLGDGQTGWIREDVVRERVTEEQQIPDVVTHSAQEMNEILNAAMPEDDEIAFTDQDEDGTFYLLNSEGTRIYRFDFYETGNGGEFVEMTNVVDPSTLEVVNPNIEENIPQEVSANYQFSTQYGGYFRESVQLDAETGRPFIEVYNPTLESWITVHDSFETEHGIQVNVMSAVTGRDWSERQFPARFGGVVAGQEASFGNGIEELVVAALTQVDGTINTPLTENEARAALESGSVPTTKAVFPVDFVLWREGRNPDYTGAQLREMYPNAFEEYIIDWTQGIDVIFYSDLTNNNNSEYPWMGVGSFQDETGIRGEINDAFGFTVTKEGRLQVHIYSSMNAENTRGQFSRNVLPAAALGFVTPFLTSDTGRIDELLTLREVPTGYDILSAMGLGSTSDERRANFQDPSLYDNVIDLNPR